MLAGAGAVGIGWLRAARLWPTRASLARRVDELERAFPAWQAEMVRLATTASDQYAQSKVERERAQAQHAGVERARKAKQQEIEDPEAAFRAHVAQLPPEQRARAQREHEKARIAARFG
jgi:hypothetical protein